MRASATRANHAAVAAPASRVHKGTRATTLRNNAKKNIAAAPKSRTRRQKQADAYAELPSRRAGRNMRCVNPFKRPTGRKSISKFAAAYDRREIPFRIRHSGSGSNALQWDVHPEDIASYDPLLVYVADGLCENRHPFTFMATTAFQQMLETKSGPKKAVPCLRGVVEALRHGLMVKNESVTMAVLRAVVQLSAAVREQLTPYYKFLVTQIYKRGLVHKFTHVVDTTLQTLERNGGPDAFKQIKSKLPAYQSTIVSK